MRPWRVHIFCIMSITTHSFSRFTYSFISIGALLALTLYLAGCSQPRADERPLLVVSIEPLRYVAEAVAGPGWRVETLMPQGASPETYEPTPRRMQHMQGARLLLCCGTLGFEATTLPRLAAAAQAPPLLRLDGGITPLAATPHSHEGHAVHHADDESADPHVWMSARNLKLMARNLCQALQQTDSLHHHDYALRLHRFEQRIDSVDAALQHMLRHARGQHFLIFHPALGYFARDYGLHQLAVEHDGKEPSAARMAALTTKVKQQGVHTVFISREHTGMPARRIAEELQLKLVEINPLAYDVPAQMLLIAQAMAQR